MGTVVVIQFPGVNCEYETVRALAAAGLDARIMRWNDSLARLRSAAAVVLPGGFSYQDRIRAGVVAAKDRIVDEVFEAAARGVPVLGICNGAQILVEAGIVPGESGGEISIALAPNQMPDREGYYCRWVRLKKGPADCVFTSFLDEWREDRGTVPCPVAHAEGRFTTASPDVLARLERGEGVALYYADEEGRTASSFPQNPNGSLRGIAGVTNDAGNVLALMPHPERAGWLHQVPEYIGGYWGRMRLEAREDAFRAGPGLAFFESLKKAIE